MRPARGAARRTKKRAPEGALCDLVRSRGSEALLALVKIAVVLDARDAQPRHAAAIDRPLPAGIGNHSDMLGRCFMEHLNASLGRFVTNDAEFWERQSLEIIAACARWS